MDTPMEFDVHPDDPITLEDLERLNAFLCSDRVPGETLAIDELDGLMAGLICGPDLVPPSEWMPVLWGGEGPAWKTVQEARRILDLLMRLWNNSARTINAGSGYEPILGMRRDESGEEVPTVAGWCYGFTLGIRLRNDLWFGGRSRKVMELLAPVGAFLSNPKRKGARGAPDDSMSAEALIGAIPPMVHGLRAYWLKKNPARPGTKRRSNPRSRPPSKTGPGSKKPSRGTIKRGRKKKPG